MAIYKSNAGNILQPGAQINRLSSYNNEGVYAWPGVEAYELIGYVQISSSTASTPKLFDLNVPSPDRRTDDRVRDNRTSMVVPASSTRPAYIYNASICVAQDIPINSTTSSEPGFPANPVTANLVTGNATDVVLFGPNNSGSPFGIPSTQANGLNAASSFLTAASSTIAQGSSHVSPNLPFLNTISGTYTQGDFAGSMFYRVTSDTTMRVFNTTGTTQTSANGGGLSVSATDAAAGRSAYIVCRVNYLRAATAVSWNDIQGFIDYASQVGGDDI